MALPFFFIKKRDSSLRQAVDYYGLNRVTKNDRYPLPLIPDSLEHLAPTHTFTKIDLRGASDLVRIAEGGQMEDHLSHAIRLLRIPCRASRSHQSFRLLPALYEQNLPGPAGRLHNGISGRHPHLFRRTYCPGRLLRRLRASNLFTTVGSDMAGLDSSDLRGNADISWDGIGISRLKMAA